MKRALFKLGRLFEVATRTEEVSYRITVDVSEWLSRQDWDFPIVALQPTVGETEAGTDITVFQLTDETKTWLSLAYNETALKNEISRRHHQHINDGHGNSAKRYFDTTIAARILGFRGAGLASGVSRI